jgi:hypothetical protein
MTSGDSEASRNRDPAIIQWRLWRSAGLPEPAPWLSWAIVRDACRLASRWQQCWCRDVLGTGTFLTVCGLLCRILRKEAGYVL